MLIHDSSCKLKSTSKELPQLTHEKIFFQSLTGHKVKRERHSTIRPNRSMRNKVVEIIRGL